MSMTPNDEHMINAQHAEEQGYDISTLNPLKVWLVVRDKLQQ